MDTKRIGNIGEAYVLAKLVELEIPVYIPFGDNESADLIADINGKLCKIQIKTCSSVKDNETYIVDLRRNKNPWSAKEGKDHETYDDVDYFATYNTITKNVCLFDLKLFNQASVTLRINKPQVILKTMRFEEDYLIERVLK